MVLAVGQWALAGMGVRGVFFVSDDPWDVC